MNPTPEQQTPTPAPKKKRTWKGTVIAVIGVAALAGLSWYLTHRPAAGPGGPGGPRAGAGGPPAAGMMGARRGGPATTVGVAKAEKADIPVILDALGTVTARATATVRPQVSGVLTEVKFREGQMVKAGQVLAVIDPRPFDIALAQATGQRLRDEAQLDNAKLMLERYRTLLAQDSIAKQDVDTQAALVKQLEGTVAADRAAERTARLNLDYSQIKAPISGRVGLRVVDVGNTVSSGDATGIAVITQTTPIDVQFAIPQDRIGELRETLESGETPVVTALDRTRAVTLDTGKFLALDNQVDTTTGTVRAKAGFANDKGTLFPSQFVNVRMVLRTVKDAVTVPINALRHSSEGDYVYVLDAKTRTVALRRVKSGLSTVDKVQIVSGLQAGEQVITEGGDRLKDGATVALPGDKPGGNRRQGGPGQQGMGPGAAAGMAKDGVAVGENGERRRRRPEGAGETGASASAPSSPEGANAAPVNGENGERRRRMREMAGDATPVPGAEVAPTAGSEEAAERRRRWRERMAENGGNPGERGERGERRAPNAAAPGAAAQ